MTEEPGPAGTIDLFAHLGVIPVSRMTGTQEEL
jgi:hypothetical protein